MVYASDRQGNGDSDIWMQELRPDGSKQDDPFQITFEPGDETNPTVSPDGRRVAYQASGTVRGVYLRTVGEDRAASEPTLLCRRGRGPKFSPDGRWLAYWVGPMGRMLTVRGESMWIVPAAGGKPQRMCPELFNVAFPVWSPDSRKLLFCGKRPADATDRPDAIWWVAPIDGGAATPVDIVPRLRENRIEWPSVCVPLCWTQDSSHVILLGALNQRFMLWAAPLSPNTLQLGNLQQLTTGGAQALHASAAANNRICLADGEYDFGLWATELDASRTSTKGPLVSVADNPLIDSNASASVDGQRIVFHSNRDGDFDIFCVQGDAPAARLIGGVGDDGNQAYAVITADGQKVAFLEGAATDYDDDFTTLCVAELHDQAFGAASKHVVGRDLGIPLDWHPESPTRFLITDNNGMLKLLDVKAARSRTILRRSGFWIGQGRFSPDGRWIAFVANGQIFVVPFKSGPAVAADWIPLTDWKSDDSAPDWSPDGSAIYFLSDRDGRQCVWRQSLDPTTMRPEGRPNHVHHFRAYRLSPAFVGSHLRPLTVCRDRLLFCLSNYSGNILVADLELR